MKFSNWMFRKKRFLQRIAEILKFSKLLKLSNIFKDLEQDYTSFPSDAGSKKPLANQFMKLTVQIREGANQVRVLIYINSTHLFFVLLLLIFCVFLFVLCFLFLFLYFFLFFWRVWFGNVRV